MAVQGRFHPDAGDASPDTVSMEDHPRGGRADGEGAERPCPVLTCYREQYSLTTPGGLWLMPDLIGYPVYIMNTGREEGSNRKGYP